MSTEKEDSSSSKDIKFPKILKRSQPNDSDNKSHRIEINKNQPKKNISYDSDNSNSIK